MAPPLIYIATFLVKFEYSTVHLNSSYFNSKVVQKSLVDNKIFIKNNKVQMAHMRTQILHQHVCLHTYS